MFGGSCLFNNNNAAINVNELINKGHSLLTLQRKSTKIVHQPIMFSVVIVTGKVSNLGNTLIHFLAVSGKFLESLMRRSKQLF